jgi:hypothetical protein
LKRKFPVRIVLLLLVVFCLTAWNALALWTALAWRGALNQFESEPGYIVTAVSGLIWMIVGILLLMGIWQGKSWAANLLFGAAACYTLWYWTELLVWEAPHPNWQFAIVVNLVMIGFVRFASRSLTREAYEQKNENPKFEGS